MIQLPFPSTIEEQPRNVTFLSIKTVVRKVQKTTVRRAHVLGQSSAWTRGGGGVRPHTRPHARTEKHLIAAQDLSLKAGERKMGIRQTLVMCPVDRYTQTPTHKEGRGEERHTRAHTHPSTHQPTHMHTHMHVQTGAHARARAHLQIAYGERLPSAEAHQELYGWQALPNPQGLRVGGG